MVIGAHRKGQIQGFRDMDTEKNKLGRGAFSETLPVSDLGFSLRSKYFQSAHDMTEAFLDELGPKSHKSSYPISWGAFL